MSTSKKTSRPVYVLDSFAMLAFLNGEAGMVRVRDILQGAVNKRCRVMMSTINLGEVLYIAERETGLAQAQAVLAAIEQLPVEIIPVTQQAVLAAAHIKANYCVSYADAFAVSAAQETGGILLTADPEFKSVEDIIQIEWLNV